MSETRDASKVAHSHLVPTGATRGVDWGFVTCVGLWQLFMFVLFAAGSEYGPFNTFTTVNPPGTNATVAQAAQFAADQLKAKAEVDANAQLYPMFQDVHIMMFVGFAFLMTFLSRYSWSAVGLNFLLCVLVIQWNILTHHFWSLVIGGKSFEDVTVSVKDLITGDFAAAAVLIAFGAVLGRTSPLQLAVMAFIQNLLFTLHEEILVKEFKITDIGGSIVVHAFGALFGVAVSFVLGKTEGARGSPYTSRTNAVTSFIGTLFLWAFWPSFNSALGDPTGQQRAIVNTVLALCGSAVSAFLVSHLARRGRLSTEDIQNATLAGGVAIGTSANFIVHPSGAIFVGLLAGTVSTLGFAYIGPFMADVVGVEDTCGVLYLHGIPGLLAGLISSVVAYRADTDAYGPSLTTIFPERGNGRNATEVAGFQAAAVALVLGYALVGGLLTGLLLKLPLCNAPLSLYDDREVWAVEDADRFPNEFGQPDEETGLLSEDHTYPLVRTTAPEEGEDDADHGGAPVSTGSWTQSAVAPTPKDDGEEDAGQGGEVEMTSTA